MPEWSNKSRDGDYNPRQEFQTAITIGGIGVMALGALINTISPGEGNKLFWVGGIMIATNELIRNVLNNQNNV